MPTGIYVRTENHREKLSKSHINKKENVWKYIDKKSNEKCWEWMNYITPDGYGEFMIDYKRHKVHRIVYELTYGSIPKGMLVCHICDNPKCCNPKHLFLGTVKDNINDMDLKHRRVVLYGEKCGNSKLNSQKVKEIRKLHSNENLSQREIAKKYNISQTTVWFIVNNKHWKHI